MQEALNQKIDAFVAANKEQILKDIATLVSINSVEGAPEEGAPYGAGPVPHWTRRWSWPQAWALRPATARTISATPSWPVPMREVSGYHLPCGRGAGGQRLDGRPLQDGDPRRWMIGRGVADDKGPMVATLYALKFLKEEGVSLRYPIRALVGDNEETHMHDVDYYLANYPAPVFCFTPDAEFPVCNGEKGHFDGKLVSPVCNGVIKDFVGGVATNAVPDRASAFVATDITKLRNAPNITLEPEGDGVRIRGWGKSGHAAMPEGTVNAIGLVVNYLLDNGLCNDAERAIWKPSRSCTTPPQAWASASTAPTDLRPADHHRRQDVHGGWPDGPDHGQPLPHLHRRRHHRKADPCRHRHRRRADGCGSAKPFYIEADTPAIKPASTPTTKSPARTQRPSPWAAALTPVTSPMLSALARSTAIWCFPSSAARCTARTRPLPSTSCWKP